MGVGGRGRQGEAGRARRRQGEAGEGRGLWGSNSIKRPRGAGVQMGDLL